MSRSQTRLGARMTTAARTVLRIPVPPSSVLFKTATERSAQLLMREDGAQMEHVGERLAWIRFPLEAGERAEP
jgi:hypothetical protein